MLLHGEVKASYFWDDGSGINGDTGAPASGEPMQEGLFAAPSWPLGTEGYVTYNGERADFFIGDRGPGVPSNDCHVMLDLDGKTFANLTGESWDDSSLTVSGGNGHIDVEYYITKWGDGNGTEGTPHPFQDSSTKCDSAVSELPKAEKTEETPKEESKAEDSGGEESTDQAAAGNGTEGSEDSQDQSGAAGGGDQAPPGGGDAQQAAPGSGGATDTTAGTEAGTGNSFDLASNDLPMASSGVTLAIVAAAAATVFVVKQRNAAVHGDSSGRHRKPGLMARVARKVAPV
ncbi:hypothetical protein Nans01_05790 [Nocardiopsis ansamitocini]|uniref:Uncharacterized protein n=1 Tax=Nocardiopsis ansamitocini TaxID=1670832 RepID=A0A9W6P329_9ACTN|nr:hypothetical protein Nans01_05790 [Nocardiopsis ansamitocini]